MSLMDKPPRGLKTPKPKPDPWYLAEVRRLPCCICLAYGEQQLSATTAHHPICDRHSLERVPDREAIPLCDGHHQGTFDTSKIAIHKERAEWVVKYGSDREYIAQTQDMILGKEIGQ